MEVVEIPSYSGPRSPQKPRGGVSKLKRKPSTLKRATVKNRVSTRKKKTPEAKLKAQLWELCKQIIRKQYGNTCYTCEAPNLSGANWHTGHFLPSSICGLYLRYDLRNLRPQCYRCNINLVGNGAVFSRNLVRYEGQAFVDQLFADKEVTIKANRAWFEEKINDYQQILAGLTTDSVP